jgi:hypothetical protein
VEGEECDEKIQQEKSCHGEGARSSSRNTKNRCSFIEKITLDDVRASWFAGYVAARSARCAHFFTQTFASLSVVGYGTHWLFAHTP